MSLNAANSSRKSALPAWLLSTLVHLLVVILLPLVFTTTTKSGRTEPGREVSIVLSRVSDKQMEYFADHAPASAAAGSDATESEAASLPATAAAASMLSSEIALPTPNAPLVAATNLLETPQYTVSGQGRVPSSVDPAAIEAEQTALRAARAARGPSTRLALFGGTAASGRTFVFLIDRSRSMGNQGLGALQAAERELQRALAALRPNHRFQVVAYHYKCVFLNTRKLLPATEENKTAVSGHLSGLAAFGATEHEMALISGLYLEPDVIFLLTDGGEPALDTGQLRRIRKLAGSRTTIHCVQFGFGPLQDSDNFLSRLAAQNGGGYGYVDMSIK